MSEEIILDFMHSVFKKRWDTSKEKFGNFPVVNVIKSYKKRFRLTSFPDALWREASKRKNSDFLIFKPFTTEFLKGLFLSVFHDKRLSLKSMKEISKIILERIEE